MRLDGSGGASGMMKERKLWRKLKNPGEKDAGGRADCGRLDVPRENEKRVYNMGVVGLDGKCRETGYDRRRQSAVKWKPELRHIINIWRELSVWGPLNYEQHSPFGTDPSGTVDIPNKIPC
ncbi:hypothetical protein ALC53_05998 [Atta colombica]|uniref:Uncharacterized protein n=1 Tax=Atta colombica TaxID=520822 RepID=A0A195BH94_9HYME|nr:hypothetical protein ALC53_05998 [Atta colombica]